MPTVAANPFPGVNPFVEAEDFWRDFRHTLVVMLDEQLLQKLPDDYDALLVPDNSAHDAINEREDAAVADAIARRDGRDVSTDAVPPGAVLMRPLPMIEEMPSRLELCRRHTREPLTVIRLMSPSDKTREGLALYRERQARLVDERVNCVDIDLLLDGFRLPFDAPLPRGDGFVFVTRAARPSRVECYAWTLRDRPPTIHVPLGDGDPDLSFDLASAYDEAFTRGGSPRRQRYERPLPGVDAATAAWAESLVDAAAAAGSA